jgi:hypothetical protein
MNDHLQNDIRHAYQSIKKPSWAFVQQPALLTLKALHSTAQARPEPREGRSLGKTYLSSIRTPTGVPHNRVLSPYPVKPTLGS